jgi:hypothetical protein
MLQGNDILDVEKDRLVQFLLSVLYVSFRFVMKCYSLTLLQRNGSKAPLEARLEALNTLLTPYLKEFEATDEQIFASPQAFLTFLGLEDVIANCTYIVV